MKKIYVAMVLLMVAVLAATVSAAPSAQESNCLFYTETVQGEGGYSVCDDAQANFRSAFEAWGLQKVGYPISMRYERYGFVTQAFQKAIMQWRADSQSVVLVNIFDDLHNNNFDEVLLQTRQTPNQLPAGWDGEGLSFAEVVQKRQALLDARPALRAAYFASSDPLTFFGLPTSEIQDMGNHYAVRLQRAVLQEWKEDVPWAQAGEVTIANGGDIAKELGDLPVAALQPELISATETPSGSEGGQNEVPSTETVTIRGEVWADNWFAFYLGNQLIQEDSVPITTERSFNAESFTFEATYPMTLNFIVKDFKENDTGLEYIGTNRQQMGDGGFIAQFTNTETGELIAVTDSSWTCMVIHEAPLDKSCEQEANPVAGQAPCGFSSLDEPVGWKDANFDDSGFRHATVYSEAQVSPRGGYNQIRWDSSAELIWGPDLETNNTLLCRLTVGE